MVEPPCAVAYGTQKVSVPSIVIFMTLRRNVQRGNNDEVFF